MDITDFFRQNLIEKAGGISPETDLSALPFSVEIPREASHGDFSTNIAMLFARQGKKSPSDLAQQIIPIIEEMPFVARAQIAGPGFINWTVKPDFFLHILSIIAKNGENYGRAEKKSEAVNVEFVSANPTGPLHIGHVRGAVFGDVLANVLSLAGYDVTREYYVNDAGAQIDALARSVWFRYCELFEQKLAQKPAKKPEEFYPGDYLIETAQKLKKTEGDRFLNKPESEWLEIIALFSVEAMLELIQQDLALLAINFDVFSSERTLIKGGRVEEMMEQLKQRDLIYKGLLEKPKGGKKNGSEEGLQQPQWLFRASNFGDDSDRPLFKRDGGLTYFASDIAYHYDKYRRTGGQLIDVLGADHGGYVKRILSASRAACGEEISMKALICQLVKILEDGKPVRMSKRAGSFVLLSDLVNHVGPEAIRFFMLLRKNDAPLDFDLKLVKEQNRDNPVFYVQYAHARCHSVFRMAEKAFPCLKADYSSPRPEPDSIERALILRLCLWPSLIRQVAERAEPHRIAFYLCDLASLFHSLWTRGKEKPDLRFIDSESRAKTQLRLALVESVAYTISMGLRVLGITPLKEMRE